MPILISISIANLAFVSFMHCGAGYMRFDNERKGDYLTYYKNGTIRALLVYHGNGKIIRAICYHPRGNSEPCDTEKHGIPDPLKIYRPNGITKDQVYTFHEEGTIKTSVFYNLAEKKTIKTTHYENGKTRKLITYQDDGKTKKNRITYYEINGNQKLSVTYQADGKTKKTKTSHYKSNGNPKETINYNDDEIKKSSYLYYESTGNPRAFIIYTEGREYHGDFIRCYDIRYNVEICSLQKHSVE